MIWVLIGMPGTGKSTVGAALAAEVGARLVDLDREIERRESRSISDIFLAGGEAEFRRIEAGVLSEILVEGSIGDLGVQMVIATGGGAVASERGRELLRSLRGSPGYWVVWLDATNHTIASRVDPTGRPLLDGATGDDLLRRVGTLAEVRRSWYEECASMRIGTDHMSPAEVAREIVAAGTATDATVARWRDA